MRTRTHRLILGAVLAALNGPAALTAIEYKVSDFLPLAVGNSWTCSHFVNDPFERLPDWPWTAWENADGVFTLTVERTEEIGGKTYFVLSDMPSGGWPPAPPGFIAGKKLRWKGGELMVYTGTGEQTLFNFGLEVFEYEPTSSHPVPRTGFGFPADDLEEWLEERLETLGESGSDEVHSGVRQIDFLANFGVWACYEEVHLSDAGAFTNQIAFSYAALVESAEGTGGPRGSSGETKVVRRVSRDEARRGVEGTVTSSVQSSWGQVKKDDR